MLRTKHAVGLQSNHACQARTAPAGCCRVDRFADASTPEVIPQPSGFTPPQSAAGGVP